MATAAPTETAHPTPEAFRTERGRVLAEIFELLRAGVPPHLIELTERQTFPYLIPCSVRTGRDARRTGVLLGRPAPPFIRRGRNIFYRFSDTRAWLESAEAHSSTAAAQAAANE